MIQFLKYIVIKNTIDNLKSFDLSTFQNSSVVYRCFVVCHCPFFETCMDKYYFDFVEVCILTQVY